MRVLPYRRCRYDRYGVGSVSSRTDRKDTLVKTRCVRCQHQTGNAEWPATGRRGYAPVQLLEKGIASSVITELAHTHSNQYGALSIDGTAPGAYHLYAFEKVQDDSWKDPGLLREIDDKGVAFRFEEGAAKSVESQ